MSERDGVLTRSPGGGTIRFERWLRHPIDKVWAALTERDRLAEWLGEGEIEPRPGGRVHIAFTVVDPPAILETTVQKCDPPHLLQFPFGGPDDGVVRFELAEEGDGTRLVLTQSMVAAGQLGDNAAGWHVRLDMLAAALVSGMQELSWSKVETLNTRYGEIVDKVS